MSSSYGSRQPQSETADLRGHRAQAGASASTALSVGSGQDVGKAALAAPTVSQSVRDALADAETLRLFLRSSMSPFEWRFRSGLCLRAGTPSWTPDVVNAIHRGRAAYAVVPALREAR